MTGSFPVADHLEVFGLRQFRYLNRHPFLGHRFLGSDPRPSWFEALNSLSRLWESLCQCLLLDQVLHGWLGQNAQATGAWPASSSVASLRSATATRLISSLPDSRKAI